MANTSQKHKEKRSQKRKDRQLKRQQKQELKKAEVKRNNFMMTSMKSMKGLSKSLPGFLAKHSDTICRWLDDYCMLFQKADDAYIDYFKFMDRLKRDQLVQDYVDIRVFLSLVQDLKSKSACKLDEDAGREKEDIEKEQDRQNEDCKISEENIEQAVD